MRRFVLVACSVLVAIGVGAGVIAAGALPAGATGPRSFAHTVLGEAIVPPGARLTTKVASTWLESPLETPGFGGLIDLHRLYLLDEPPASVESYIEAHLPKGANVTSNETNSGPMGTATGFVVSLSTSGPHEYLAQLAYDLVPVGATNDTELRVDSQTVWLPSRSAGELAPAGDIVEVTGFSQTGFAYASSGPVTVRLDNAQATKLRAVFDSLQLGPAKTGCMESSLLYKVTFRPAAGPASSFEADGWGCDREATVTGHGKRMSPLYDKNCSLLRDVIEVLPSHRAEGTRDSLGRCRT